MKRCVLASAIAAAALLATAATTWAQLPAGDLRLWLKADTLQVAEDGQIMQWVDQSSYGTVFAPRTASDQNIVNGPVEEFPHLETVTVNGRTFQTVQFERNGTQAGDPNVDRSGSTDRLYQMTNLTPGSDPLAIADGTSMTSFTVFKPKVTTSGGLGTQVVWAKRGNDASLLELGIQPNGRLLHVTYDSITVYQTQAMLPENKWTILNYSLVEQGDNDALLFNANSTEDPLAPLTNYPVATNGGVIADRNDGINEDPVGSVEPFGIGGHAQDCCGESESFAGNIAEIIIYGRQLTQAESDQVYAYLTDKYLAIPEPGTVALASLAMLVALGVRRGRG